MIILQKYKSSIGWKLGFSFFMQYPSFRLIISDGAMISWYSFNFDDDASFSWSTNRFTTFGTISIYIQFVLDLFRVLFWADPGWTSSKVGEVIFVNGIVFWLRAHYVEFWGWLECRSFLMGGLVEVVVDYFAYIYDCSLLDSGFIF